MRQFTENFLHFLGICYNTGMGVGMNEREAARWYRISAEKNNPRGQNNLGSFYQFGMGGVPVNFEEAARLFRLSAMQGDATGQRNLGKCYMNGTGVSRDPSEARAWLKRAANQGDKISARLLKAM